MPDLVSGIILQQALIGLLAAVAWIGVVALMNAIKNNRAILQEMEDWNAARE